MISISGHKFDFIKMQLYCVYIFMINQKSINTYPINVKGCADTVYLFPSCFNFKIIAQKSKRLKH